MDDVFTRVIENLIGRVSGPMKFRLILQPVMSITFAVIAGLKDARKGRPAYFWAIFTEPDHRRDLVREGWKSVGKIFVLAVLMDIVYQYIVFRWFYPVEALLVAAVLAFLPYLLIRGPVNRIARWK
jgi:hypothetical protein